MGALSPERNEMFKAGLSILLCCFAATTAEITYYVATTNRTAPCSLNSSTCHELSYYTSQPSAFFSSNTIFYFFEGRHVLEQQELIVINNVSNLTLKGIGVIEQGAHETVMQSTVVIDCNGTGGGFAFFNSSSITIDTITLTNCGSIISIDDFGGYGSVALAMIHLYKSHLLSVSVQNSSSFGLLLINSFNITIEDSSLFRNQYPSIDTECAVLGTLFCPGGNAFAVYSDKYLDENSLPLKHRSRLEILRSNISFGLGIQYGFGGGLKIEFINSVFVYSIDIIIDGVVAYGNAGISGANFNIETSNRVASLNLIINNTLSLFGNTLSFAEELVAKYSGILSLTNGAGLHFSNNADITQDVTISIYNSEFSHNLADIGGGMSIFWISSTAGEVLLDSCVFRNNTGGDTTALFINHIVDFGYNSSSPNVAVTDVTVDANQASNEIPLQSAITIQNVPTVDFSNLVVSNNPTTGLTAYSSNLVFSGESNSFFNNSGNDGGGMALYGSSYIVLNRPARVSFRCNHAAGRGGGMFVSQPITPNNAQCFFQLIPDVFGPMEITMSENTAAVAGSDLYGGDQLDTCFSLAGFDTLFEFSDQTGQSVISSSPTKVCTCPELENVDCSIYEYSTTAVPGKMFSIPAGTVGNRNGLTPAVIAVNFTDTDIVDTFATTTANCTSLVYTLRATNTNQTEISIIVSLESTLILAPQKFIARVTILPCPVGFELNTEEGICDCSNQLRDMISNVTCNVVTDEISRQGNAWMGFSNETNCTLVSSACPLDYCNQELVTFNVTDSDPQCALNRSGVLCGGCADRLSLLLGSNRCGECSNAYITLLLPFGLAGIILVALLILLNLTVSVGTVNGLIFYANIVKIGESFFFPQGPVPVLSQFISWINLDLGIELCFFDGMTGCYKAWLQFVFPIYIWLILTLIIIFARFSVRLQRLVGSHVVPVLSTLLLLSYTKLIRTVIQALYNTYVSSCEGQTLTVWFADGNIPYLTGCHLPLFIVSLIVLVLFIFPYTLFLLAAPFIEVYLTGYKCFRWFARLKPVLDAYGGPYKDKFRVWTGVLLLVRVVLALISSLAADSMSISIAAMVTTSVILLTVHCFARQQVYNKWYLNILEITFILNLILLGYFTIQPDEELGKFARILLLSIALIKFVGILLYHVLLRLKPRLDLIGVFQTKARKVFKQKKESKTLDDITFITSAGRDDILSDRHRETLLGSDYHEFIIDDNS